MMDSCFLGLWEWMDGPAIGDRYLEPLASCSLPFQMSNSFHWGTDLKKQNDKIRHFENTERPESKRKWRWRKNTKPKAREIGLTIVPLVQVLESLDEKVFDHLWMSEEVKEEIWETSNAPECKWGYVF